MDVDPKTLPEDPATLQDVVGQLLGSLQEKERRIEHLEHQLEQLLRRLYGPRSERIDPNQLVLFAEEVLGPSVPAQIDEVESTEPSRRKKGHGRRRLPEDLPRKRVVHDVPAEERMCGRCGKEMPQIGQDTSEQLEYVPASLFVLEHVCPKYACRDCEETVVSGEKPRQPIEKGLPGGGLLAHVVVSKYADHLPLYRQERVFSRHGVHLSRSTLCDWCAATARELVPIHDLMIQKVLASDIIQTDDTPIRVQDKGKTRTGRIWVYLGDDDHPYMVYDYTPTRQRDGPADFLGDYEGYLQADAFSGYDGIYAAGTVIEVACWAHARRKFYEARTSDAARAHTAMAYADRLWAIDKAAKVLAEQEDRPLAEVRFAFRQEQARPVLEDFGAWLREQSGAVLPKSPMGMAINYCLSNWEALNRYLDDGRLVPDNNASERALRAVAIGRKNWLFAGSDKGGRTAAVLYSLIASCRRHAVEPEGYLRDVLRRIADHPITRLEELLPDQWKPLEPEQDSTR
jgi:transposase